MKLLREDAEVLVHAASGRKDRILKELKKHGYKVSDDSETYGYMNLHVTNDDGSVVRIYRGFGGDVKVQMWRPVVLVWSGIPTFEPSGRDSF